MSAMQATPTPEANMTDKYSQSLEAATTPVDCTCGPRATTPSALSGCCAASRASARRQAEAVTA